MMGEYKREPIEIVVDAKRYDAFDCEHSLADILRYSVDTQGSSLGRETRINECIEILEEMKHE